MRALVSLLTVATLAVAPAARAQDAPFKLSGQWAVDFGDDYCRLAGDFSNGEDTISLGMERIQPGAFLRLMLSGDAIRPFRGASQLGYHFLPAGTSQKAAYFRMPTADGKEYLFIDNLTLAPMVFTPPVPGQPPAPPPVYSRQGEQDSAGGITGIRIEEGLVKPVQIEASHLPAAIAVLQQCADDLLKTWGLDAEKHKTLTVPAIPNFSPDGWLPAGMISFGDFAKFTGNGNQVRLLIDAAGKPTACTIHTPTLDRALNDRICSTLMEKASFQPAKDAAGAAMASYWFGSPMFLGPPMGGRR
ncbi:MAG TPA: hypothetical protein VI168_02655 [Croceibacterium sp.]